jgi:membrane fusion protein, multidrug efflux system
MAMPVVAARVERASLEEQIPLVGQLKAREEVSIVSEVDARVVEIGFEEGAPVEQGQTLYRLDSRKQDALVAEAQARLDLAQSELRRGRELLDRNTIPPQEFDRLQAAVLTAEAALLLATAGQEDTVISAPFPGTMAERIASPGQFVSRGSTLGTLTQLDPLELEFQIPERYVSQVAEGLVARLTTIAYPGEPFAAELSYIAPELATDSRTLTVKALIDNADGRLRPGMFGTIALIFSARDDALVVPESSLRYQGDLVFVTTVDADRLAAFQPVEVGLRLAGKAEILSGLAEGDIVVIEGFQKLGPGSPVSFAPASAQHGVDPDLPPVDSPPEPADAAADRLTSPPEDPSKPASPSDPPTTNSQADPPTPSAQPDSEDPPAPSTN